MAIGTVIRRIGGLFVYDEQGRQAAVISLLPNDELQGYTGSTISVRRGGFVVTYDEDGRQLSIVTGSGYGP